MTERVSAERSANATLQPWIVRVGVLTVFALTVWLCGPKAAEVLAARFDQAAQNSPHVALDRVGFASRPEWMDKNLLVAVSAALAPWLQEDVPILDDQAQRGLRDGLASVAWVRSAEVQRVFPDRLRLVVDLRQPILAVRAADGSPLCLVDREAVQLPFVDTPLPVVRLYREGGAGTMSVAVGQRCTERRVTAAVAIALEWRDQLAPLVAGCPRLLEVDTTNLGEQWLRGPSYPEVRVQVARSDGAGVVLNYDRPVDSPLPRLPVATKAGVLNKVLARHPGLVGLVAADLRFAKRWADYLQPRPAGVRDPHESWNTLFTPR
ncbi:MAG: hypothetical protein JNK15_14495 [Planctomycetes bacterium]|nr:hypothetical protein [Planctomycetota bacterium]